VGEKRRGWPGGQGKGKIKPVAKLTNIAEKLKLCQNSRAVSAKSEACNDVYDGSLHWKTGREGLVDKDRDLLCDRNGSLMTKIKKVLGRIPLAP